MIFKVHTVDLRVFVYSCNKDQLDTYCRKKYKFTMYIYDVYFMF